MKRTAALLLITAAWIFCAAPTASAKNINAQQLKAARKAEKKQQKAQRKYAKAQRKAQRKMEAYDRKHTHDPYRKR